MPEQIHQQLFTLLRRGDEKEVKDFLTTHLEQFPEELQGEIATYFFEEGLREEAAGSKAIFDFQKDGTKLMRTMEKYQEELEKKEKLLTIKESL